MLSSPPTGRIARNTATLVVISLLLGSCSTFQFLYNQLDWILLNRADHYVDLNSSQRAALENDVAALQEWHRNTQLTRYVALLEELSIRTQKPLTDTDFIWMEEEMRALYFPLMERAIPPIARLLSTLDDEQIEYLKEQLDEDLEEKYEYMQYSQAKRLEYRIDNAIDQFEGGYGDLDNQQERLIISHVTKSTDTGNLTRTHRMLVNQQLLTLLSKHPSQQEVESHLRVIWLYPERNYTEDYRHNMKVAKFGYYQMMEGTHDLASQPQIDFLNKKLLGYRQDIAELSKTDKKTTISCNAHYSKYAVNYKKGC